ncbi:MAG: hypothetical protein Ct9H90mP3_8390 [Flammeovirgaceae bacterium]|nr:MAG: hypothetical protein Ct9H90mP3_8390 [Flammeovirgaceae bacterium]
MKNQMPFFNYKSFVKKILSKIIMFLEIMSGIDSENFIKRGIIFTGKILEKIFIHYNGMILNLFFNSSIFINSKIKIYITNKLIL